MAKRKKTSNVQVNWHRRLEGIRVDSRLNGNFAGNQIKVSQYSRCPGNDEGVQMRLAAVWILICRLGSDRRFQVSWLNQIIYDVSYGQDIILFLQGTCTA